MTVLHSEELIRPLYFLQGVVAALEDPAIRIQVDIAFNAADRGEISRIPILVNGERLILVMMRRGIDGFQVEVDSSYRANFVMEPGDLMSIELIKRLRDDIERLGRLYGTMLNPENLILNVLTTGAISESLNKVGQIEDASNVSIFFQLTRDGSVASTILTDKSKVAVTQGNTSTPRLTIKMSLSQGRPIGIWLSATSVNERHNHRVGDIHDGESTLSELVEDNVRALLGSILSGNGTENDVGVN